MNPYLIIIIAILAGEYLISVLVETLNVRHLSTDLPEEFKDSYSAEKYRKSQEYLRENTLFNLASGAIFTAVILLFIFLGGFNAVDVFARGFGFGPIATGLIFSGALVYCAQALAVPVTAYRTFVIEEKYGFNKTTVKTFFLDIVKSWILLALIGGVALAGILWLFQAAGKFAWLYCWIAITVFKLFLTFIAPVVIMPLFNKFVPLEDGELKNAIERYAAGERFAMRGVFKMDGSRRSAKSNAFFTGLGRFRRIALFDTLIAKHTVDELVSVLAHEIGHYKKKHILKSIFFSTAVSGIMFFILSKFINNPMLFGAFRMENLSIYASIFFFGILYSPISAVFSVVGSVISRKHEYEADRYAVSTYK
ncbi:MAG: M48 family metallopeptidase, partial [Candidatus Omnitrophota bacterium]